MVTAQRDWMRRADAQTRAIVNLFKGPDAIYNIADIVRRIESGKLKIRVRALEAERALDRMAIMQSITMQSILACAAANVGVVFFVSAATITNSLLYAKCAFGVAALIGFQAFMGQVKLNKMLKKEAQYSGQ